MGRRVTWSSTAPVGWWRRYGKNEDNDHVKVHVCSEKCADTYDQLEAAVLGMPGWVVADMVGYRAMALKVPRPKKTRTA